MSCEIPGHDHSDELDVVYRCNLCHTEFEMGVVDPEKEGEARCPQCFMSDAIPIERSEYQKFVIRKGTKFR